MTTIEDQGEAEKAAAEKLIGATPLFGGVESVRVELGEDHSGEPSLWLVFRLASGLNADESWVREFSDYSTRLGLKLLHNGITRFPYTRLEPAA